MYIEVFSNGCLLHRYSSGLFGLEDQSENMKFRNLNERMIYRQRMAECFVQMVKALPEESCREDTIEIYLIFESKINK